MIWVTMLVMALKTPFKVRTTVLTKSHDDPPSRNSSFGAKLCTAGVMQRP